MIFKTQQHLRHMNRFLRLNHKKFYYTCLLKYKEH